MNRSVKALFSYVLVLLFLFNQFFPSFGAAFVNGSLSVSSNLNEEENSPPATQSVSEDVYNTSSNVTPTSKLTSTPTSKPTTTGTVTVLPTSAKVLNAGISAYAAAEAESATSTNTPTAVISTPTPTPTMINPTQAGGDDHANDISTATFLQIGQEISGSIEKAGDVDYFKFVPGSSGYYSIESTGSTNVSGFLYSELNVEIKNDGDSGTSYNFYMVCYLDVSRAYYLKVSHNSSNGTGAYGVKVTELADDCRNEFDSAKLITVDSETSRL